MIHQIFNLTRPLFVLDCETTGTDVNADRIVEIGFERWEASGMTKEYRSLVNPGVPIPEAATRIHGINDDDVTRLCSKCHWTREHHPQVQEGCAEFHPVPTFKHFATLPSFVSGLSDCDFAGKNVRFDLRIIAAEFARAGVTWGYAGARIVDAERLEQLAVPRTLSHLHEKYTGHKHDGAHGALSDVRASTTVIVAQMRAHQFLPRDLDALHQAQWPGWIDGDGKFVFVDGVPCVGRWGKHAGKAMRLVPTGYWDFIIGGEFSADVKALARAAKLRLYPEERK